MDAANMEKILHIGDATSAVHKSSWPSTQIWARDIPSRWQGTLKSDERDLEQIKHSVTNVEATEGVRLTSLRSRAIRILTSLLCILLPRGGKPVRKKAFHELHPLAYLDALRGYLAIMIFTGHTMPRDWEWIPASVLQIPWLQFPFRGGYVSLDIFFWISGYAVTYRIVGLIHAKQSDKLLDALASSIFRRYLRLFLPVLPLLLVTILATRLGIAIPPEEQAKRIVGNPFIWFLKDTGHLMNPFTHITGWFDGQTGSQLIFPFWSLGAELRASMMMFTFCTGTCKMSSRARKILILCCVPALIMWQAQWAAMAFMGMWFAECRQGKRALQASIMPAEKSLPEPNATPKTEQRTHSQPLRSCGLLLLFLYSFIALKDPYDTDKKQLFPHNYINILAPEYWHPAMKMHVHLCLAAMMMLYPLDQLKFLQQPLLTQFSQFLGELSFGIYAVHFPVRWVVWEPRYVKWTLERYGIHAFDSFWVAFPGWLGMAIVVLWAAEIFRRIDWQVVMLLKKLEDRFFDWK